MMTGQKRPAGPSLRIVLNGALTETTARSLAELIEEVGFGGAKVATALNGDFVAERGRAAAQLHAGDRVEVVGPRQGG